MVPRANRLLVLKWITNHDELKGRIEYLSNHTADYDKSVRVYCFHEIESIGLPLLQTSIGAEGIYTILSKVATSTLDTVPSSFRSFIIHFFRQEIQRLAKERGFNPNQLEQSDCIQFISHSKPISFP